VLRLIATRFALGVLTLLAVSVLIFVCTQILPGDVAAAVLFLASPQAGYITGETLHVNGGMYMP